MKTVNAPTVLVTGAAGWLGGNLLAGLTEGLTEGVPFAPLAPDVEIRALALPGDGPPAGTDGRVRWIEGNVRSDADVLRFVEGARDALLFHAAGVIHPRRVRELFEVNAEGTRRVLAAAARAGVRRAVVVSSNSPFGANPRRDHLFDEESPYRPYLGYGRSKMLGEIAAKEAHARGDLETVIVRAPWFYGPRQPERQTLFFRMVRDGKAPLVGGGLSRRSMAYTDNLVQGLLLAATTPEAAGEAFWVADARPYEMREVIDTIERVLEEAGVACTHRRLRLPAIASDVARGADRALQALGIYHSKVHVLSEMSLDIACDVGQARRVLGYRPAVELEEGLRRSVAAVRDQL